MRTIAAFDFDGTLTYRDTLIPFLTFLKGRSRTACALLKTAPHLIRFFTGEKSRQEVKETLLRNALGGDSYDACQKEGVHFSEMRLKALLRPEGIQKLLWHQNEGHETVIISANLDLYLETWGKQQNLTRVLCSQVAEREGKVSGKLVGLNCWGEEKVRRLLRWAGPKKEFTLWAYGDTRGDKPLLDLADYPFYRQF